ncbi:MAG: MMPL family transporter [Elusimicrobiota bacterium]
MAETTNPFIGLYDRIVLERPKAAILTLVAVFAFFGYWAKDFRLDASGESLVLEHDDDVRYFAAINDRYQGGDFIIITYSPPEDLFSKESLDRLGRLRDELRKLDRVSSVVTLLDVPLLKNPPGTLKELKDNIKTLESPDADMGLAVAEFRDSDLYRNLLVSPDLKATALLVNFRMDKGSTELLSRRSKLREKDYDGSLTPAEREELEALEVEFRRDKDRRRAGWHEDIAAIRALIAGDRSGARLFLGGVPMIVDDIISFIKNDLKVFGLGMLCFLILTLGVIFKRKRWVVLPMLCCSLSVLTLMGILGLSTWDVTVVSSNFISLQLIFTMSLAIHIVVRYRELLRWTPDAPNRDIVRDAVRLTFVPCLYAILTTIAGFCSLVICDILPVVNFGWMMTMGLCVSMIVTFLLLPAGLMLMKKPPPASEKAFGLPLTSFFARLTERHGAAIVAASLAIAVVTAFGITRLEVENSFIDYFKKSTDIYKGMKFIDQELGGTTPLEVMIDFAPEASAEPEPAPPPDEAFDEDFDEFAEFEEKSAEDAEKYWFTTGKLEVVNKVHDYLDGLPATGKVMSLATLWKTTRDLNEGKPFDDFALAILFNQMPEEHKDILVNPYVSIEHDQARITARIKDSMRDLRRDPLIKKIRADLRGKLGLKEDQFRVTGLMVLYNNMLQSLFRSQIQTVGFTVLALMAMFMILFRSIKISLIAIFPNLLSSMIVLGVMGLARIPLDIMTITIVAISVGIAVDNTIHYLHRFRREITKDWDYLKAMHRCHGSIGNAMFYTSLSITIGFSILGFSNFIPTILFGLLAALAMAMALVAALSLLPKLIMFFKPFGTGKT